jgi:excisionase family DNA binding protein
MVYRLLRSGTIRALKHGTTYRVHERDLELYVTSARVPAAS